MATVEVTENNFESIVKQGVVVLDFWAAWCGPCRECAPVFEAASTRHTDAAFGKVNTDTERGLAAALGIQAIPSLMVVREGVHLVTVPGARPAAALDELIGRVRALDMEEVRRDLEAQLDEPRAAKAGGV